MHSSDKVTPMAPPTECGIRPVPVTGTFLKNSLEVSPQSTSADTYFPGGSNDKRLTDVAETRNCYICKVAEHLVSSARFPRASPACIHACASFRSSQPLTCVYTHTYFARALQPNNILCISSDGHTRTLFLASRDHRGSENETRTEGASCN